jgi:hypothetical protein
MELRCSWKDNIPTELYRYIRDYLKAKDYWSLMASSKEMFEEIAYLTRVIYMNSHQIEEMLNQANVQEGPPYKRIKFPNDQVIFHANYAQMLKIAKLPGKFLVEIGPMLTSPFGIQINIDFFRRCIGLVENNVVLEVIPELFSNLKTLFCYHSTNFSPSLKCLESIESITIQSSSIDTVRGLGNIRYLRLINLFNLDDISSLTNNYCLTILNCPTILHYPLALAAKHLETDLLQLASIERMEGPVRWLALRCSLHKYHPDAIKKTFAQCNSFLYRFTIHMDGLYLIPTFLSMKCLVLHCCWDLVDISMLKLPVSQQENSRLRRLILSRCPKICDISMLGYLEDLEVSECSGISSLMGLENVPRITFQGTGLSAIPLNYKGMPGQILKFC